MGESTLQMAYSVAKIVTAIAALLLAEPWSSTRRSSGISSTIATERA
jgi:hypothetical protein